MSSAAIIGAGFSGLSAASCLAREGFEVTVLEKNGGPGGRAGKLEAAGFTFDTGPSWYWMPDVFERYFSHFGKDPADYYNLVRLDPSYRIYYGKNDYLDIPAGIPALTDLFEQLEPGSGVRLEAFLKESKYKYDIGMHDLVYRPGRSLTELLDMSLLRNVFRLHILKPISQYIRTFFKHPRIIQLLEFPILFLGSTPARTPALYSLMNYADMALGTWYPMGGMHAVVTGMTSLASSLGVTFKYNQPVDSFEIDGPHINGIWSDDTLEPCDFVVASADYHHVEQQLLPERFRKYNASYWRSRTMAPSSLLFFLGINKKMNSLEHHTLFFDEDFGQHAIEIYDTPRWPTAPQFYVSCASRTDPAMAPAGCESLVILIPVAPGLEDNERTREKYFDLVLRRLESITGEHIREHIVFKKSYAHRDFITDYNAFKGNAYGLANTLTQTANLRPSIINNKLSNLFYTGQLTVPGPGVPPSLISGQVVARELMKKAGAKKRKHLHLVG